MKKPRAFSLTFRRGHFPLDGKYIGLNAFIWHLLICIIFITIVSYSQWDFLYWYECISNLKWTPRALSSDVMSMSMSIVHAGRAPKPAVEYCVCLKSFLLKHKKKIDPLKIFIIRSSIWYTTLYMDIHKFPFINGDIQQTTDKDLDFPMVIPCNVNRFKNEDHTWIHFVLVKFQNNISTRFFPMIYEHCQQTFYLNDFIYIRTLEQFSTTEMSFVLKW